MVFAEEVFVQQSFEVLAFLTYWKTFQKIRQDETLIIQVNHHLHEKIWKGGENPFRRPKVMHDIVLTEKEISSELSQIQ